MRVLVRFFASHRDITGRDSLEMELPAGSDTRALLSALSDRYPALKSRLAFARAAVNQEYNPVDQPLQEGDEVALIPPVSGG